MRSTCDDAVVVVVAIAEYVAAVVELGDNHHPIHYRKANFVAHYV